jgi:hypothetical protein
MMRNAKIMILVVGFFLLSGCSMNKEYHYWQKRDPSSALYLTGVKAQQMLEQDISECVHVIIELTRLADVRGKVPQLFMPLGSYDQLQATQEMSGLPRWDVPEYVRDLRVDHTDFQDFDGCMNFKGWQRVKYIAPEAERRANEVYDATSDYSVRPKGAKNEAYAREMNALNRGN